jgi:hypothetical protein
MRWPRLIRVWCRIRGCRSALGGRVGVAHSLARRSRGRGRSRSRSGAEAVTRTAASAGRAALADWMALSRSIISSRSASRSPSARIWAGCGAGQQLAGRADGADRAALARPAPAGVLAAADPGYLLALAGQVPGQAQPVMPGPFHRPHDLTLPGSRPGQASSCPYPAVLAGAPSWDTTRPRASQIAAAWVSRWVSTPTTWSASSTPFTEHPPSVRWWKGGTGVEGNSRGNPVMSHGPKPGQASDQASRGWPGRCWQHRGHVISKTRQKTVRHAKSHPAATRHQPWPVPAGIPGTDMPRLTGTLMAQKINNRLEEGTGRARDTRAELHEHSWSG